MTTNNKKKRTQVPMKTKCQLPKDIKSLFDPSVLQKDQPSHLLDDDDAWFRELEQKCDVSHDEIDRWITKLEQKKQDVVT